MQQQSTPLTVIIAISLILRRSIAKLWSKYGLSCLNILAGNICFHKPVKNQ